MSTPDTPGADAASVTNVVDRVPRPGMAQALEAAIHDLITAALAFEGHMGVTVARPALPAQPGFRIVYRFDSHAHLRAWLESAEYRRLAEIADRYTLGDAHQEILVGLEAWFTPPGGMRPPPRGRMAVVSWIGIFPLAYGFNRLAGLAAPALPGVLRAAIAAALVVAAMTYVVGPFLTKTFRRWLFPDAPRQG